MCGFAGILTDAGLNRPALEWQARRMIATLTHRGPDDSGVWTDEAAGIALGFRRLAILDLSPLGHQPMASASGRYIAAFNGEIYNFRELRRELEPHGWTFRGGSDTEVLLAAFEHWGTRAAVRRFAGMFAIAVWDTTLRRLTLVRDRMGKKPLYIYRQPGCIAFGSELKALVEAPAFDRTLDPAALAAYVRCLYVPAPQTIFRHATKLPAAHLVEIDDARQPIPPPTPYWSLDDAAREGLAHPFRGGDAEALDALDEVLRAAVSSRLFADVPVGALLSGGIDSSAVVALMQTSGGPRVKTFTIGFAEGDFDEARHAARVAAHLGTDHTELRLTGDDAVALVPKLPEIYDEPLADPSGLPTLLVSTLARRSVTVALSGDGGDELFGGYNRYVYGMRVMPGAMRIPARLRRSIGRGLGSVPVSAWDRLHRAAGAAIPFTRVGERLHKLGRVLQGSTTGQMYRSMMSTLPDADALLSPETREAGASPHATGLDGDQPAHLLDRMMLADQQGYLPDDLLAKLDRASMAVSLEVRAPLLDHRVVELSWRLPRHLKIRGGLGKWALRQVLYRRVPREIIDRPKMGFSVPIDRWLRGALRSWAEQLLPDATRPDAVWDGAAVHRLWRDVQTNRRPAGAAMWAVLMCQQWRARWQV